jgi:hypothetical protein
VNRAAFLNFVTLAELRSIKMADRLLTSCALPPSLPEWSLVISAKCNDVRLRVLLSDAQ